MRHHEEWPKQIMTACVRYDNLPTTFAALRHRSYVGVVAQKICCCLTFLFVIFSSSAPSGAAAKNGLALVIGSSAYQYAPELKNPRNDAEDMAAALAALGFQVIKGIDLNKVEMDQKLREFAGALGRSEMGLFFYAGHGIQVNGENYLIPVDAKLEDAMSIDFELIRVGFVQRIMERAAKTNLIFLDACRNNPFARNLARSIGTRSITIGRGLAPLESGVGTLISFSTQPGNVALDGVGRNSPFAGALSKQIRLSSGDVSEVLIDVRREVMSATADSQVPWEHSALTARFFFRERPQQAAPAASAPETSGTAFDQEAELAFWNAVKDSKRISVLETYLVQYPSGKFAALAQEFVDQLKRDAKQAPAETTSSPQSTELALALQRELKRVGCYHSEIDGKWGATSTRAIADYNENAKTAFHTETPTSVARDAISKVFARICPEAKTEERSRISNSSSAPSSGERPDPFRYSLGVWPPYSLESNSHVSKAAQYGRLFCIAGNGKNVRRRCWWE